MKIFAIGLLGTALSLSACAAEPDEDTAPDDGTDIDQTVLAAYRAALPTRAQLRATAPAATAQAALGDPAVYPHASADIVQGINGAVEHTIDLLELITSTPPTLYNSVERTFVWGPYPEAVGYSAAYIRDTQGTGDFAFEFAFLRGIGNDLATLTPIVAGGATPDPSDDDRGVGVVLWDLTAARAFEQAHDPAFDPAEHDSGRFVALFSRAPDETAPANELALVVAVFRDFVTAREPAAEPLDLDYLYGRYITPEHTIDFIDWEANFDVTEPTDGVSEQIGVRLAFLDEGTGRAEADAVGGSIGDDVVEITECWDAALSQTYIDYNGEAQLGTEAACGLFATTLAELNIPSLDEIDPELLAILDAVASR